MQLKILHCADLHIGASESFLGPRAKQRQTETLMTFERIVSYAKNNAVPFVVIAGDLFDSNSVDFSLVGRVFECIENAGDVKFIYAAGNHDPLDVNSPLNKLKIPENMYVFGANDGVFEFPQDNVRFYGKSFGDVYEKHAEEFSLKPKADDVLNIMCIHGELTTDTNSVYYPITPQYIKNSDMDYIALGHIHKRSDIGVIGKTSFAYCGCPEGQGFDESGEKGVYICTVSKGKTEAEFVPTAFRTHIREAFDISQCAGSADASALIIDALKEKYKDAFSENLYRITLTGNISEDAAISADEICTRISEKVYFAKVKDKTFLKVDLDTLSKEPSLKGVFVKNMLEKINTAETDEQKELLTYALNLGLKSFNGEVVYDEN